MSGGTIGNNSSPDVLIIGGGIAGLTAAVDLSSRGCSVVLAEQKQRLGGRTYSFIHPETGDEVDNGQHLMMGCYHSTLRYLRTVGSIDHTDIQDDLSIVFRHASRPPDQLKTARLPAPFNVLAGLLGLKYLSRSERLSLLRVGADLLFRNPDSDRYLRSITVSQWLDDLHQPPVNRKYLWDIIAIGALNDSPDTISAALFVKVLKSAFFGSRKNASIVIPKKGLSTVLVDPAAAYIRRHGGQININASAEKITTDGPSVASVQFANGGSLTPRAVICAIPYFDIPKIFENAETAGIKDLSAFVSSPIVTIHLWYDAHFVKEKFAALIDSPLHWVFNKTLISEKKEEGLMFLTIVVSGAHDLAEREKEDLVALAHLELTRFYPAASVAKIIHSQVIKEKRATFSPTVDAALGRPPAATPLRNLFLAGDWIDTNLPATIEGAVQSGYHASALAAGYLKSGAQ